jgi:acetyl esterase/lipase
MKSLFSLVILMSLLNSCQREKSESGSVKAKTELNVSYGTDTAQRFDLYLPANRSVAATPVIVLVHGGGWNSGHRSDFVTYIDSFKRRLPDVALVNIGYRLAAPGRIFPTQEQDVKSAMEFVAANAASYGININKVAILGVSAGAHLSMLQAYKNTSPVQVKAVVDMFGPTDLTQMYLQPWHPIIPNLLQQLTGTTPQTNPEVYQQSSPAYFVNAQTPPTLILQGGADFVVDPSQSKLLADKLAAAGVPHQYVLYPTEGHGWFGANMVDSFNKIEAFFRTYLL